MLKSRCDPADVHRQDLRTRVKTSLPAAAAAAADDDDSIAAAAAALAAAGWGTAPLASPAHGMTSIKPREDNPSLASVSAWIHTPAPVDSPPLSSADTSPERQHPLSAVVAARAALRLPGFPIALLGASGAMLLLFCLTG